MNIIVVMHLKLKICLYRICSIRRHGYYLFHHAILCGFYLRATTNRERHLLNSVLSVKIFRECKGFEKSQFYMINKELQCGDLDLKQTFQFLDQPPLCHQLDLQSGSYLHVWHLQSVSEDEDELEENKLVSIILCILVTTVPLSASVHIAVRATRFVYMRMCYILKHYSCGYKCQHHKLSALNGVLGLLARFSCASGV